MPQIGFQASFRGLNDLVAAFHLLFCYLKVGSGTLIGPLTWEAPGHSPVRTSPLPFLEQSSPVPTSFLADAEGGKPIVARDKRPSAEKRFTARGNSRRVPSSPPLLPTFLSLPFKQTITEQEGLEKNRRCSESNNSQTIHCKRVYVLTFFGKIFKAAFFSGRLGEDLFTVLRSESFDISA
ncbi:hypothetical protein CEXT_472901 [Caerostris extrusa]|uniref:Uncharacterized protein n=1 Tax=Caerostris extrusa TaxID=172846 RepID=A0AAV4XB75_CAEEX|nr:hypothetical protein CEXT_472901 [Caerostris extrusa]